MRKLRLVGAVLAGLLLTPGVASAATIDLRDAPAGSQVEATATFVSSPDTGAKSSTGITNLESTVTADDGSTLIIHSLTEWQWYIRVNNGDEVSLDQHTLLSGPTAVDGNLDGDDDTIQATYEHNAPVPFYNVEYQATLDAPGPTDPVGLGGLTNTLTLNVPAPDNFPDDCIATPGLCDPRTFDVFLYIDFDIFASWPMGGPTFGDELGEAIMFDPAIPPIDPMDPSAPGYIQSEIFDEILPPGTFPGVPFMPPGAGDPTTYLVRVDILVAALTAFAMEASVFSDRRDDLQGAPMVTLVNQATPADPELNDLALVFQWQFLFGQNEFGFDSLEFSLGRTSVEVPEPTTALLLGAVLLAVASARRVRRPLT